jgi:hypothetical protein
MRDMSRVGYAFLALVILALGWYVFQAPKAPEVNWVKLVDRAPPSTYTIVANGHEQRVEGSVVHLDGLRFALATERASGLWNQVTNVAVEKDKLVTGVNPADYSAYGIDPTKRSIEADGIALSWGSKDGVGYIVDRLGARLGATDAGAVARLDAMCGRLDAEQAFPGVMPHTIAVDGHRYLRGKKSGWHAALDPLRPGCDTRVRAILASLRSLRVVDLTSTLPPSTKHLMHLDIGYPAVDVAKEGYATEVSIDLYGDEAGGGWWQVDGWPAQRLGHSDVLAMYTSAHALHGDRLYNLGASFMGVTVENAIVRRGDSEWFRIEGKNGRQLDDLSSRWDIVWSGGREYADPNCADRLVDALNAIVVSEVRPRIPGEPAWPDALRIDVTIRGFPFPETFEMRGRYVRSSTHVGTALALPELLADLRPDQFLDPVIASRAPERVIKLQRRLLDRDPIVEETWTCDDRGTWHRSFPGPGSVDQIAVQRMARALATGNALAVRLADDQDREASAHPTLEVAVRFAPKDEGKANDFTDLDETTSVDVGLAISQRDGVWRASSLGTGIAYDLDEDLVRILQADVSSPLVIPLVPALVSQIELGNAPGAGGIVTLRLAKSGWELLGDGSAKPANEVEVRRLLRDLAGLTARRRTEGAALMATEVEHSVTVLLPGAEQQLNEQMVLQIAHPGTLGAAADECVVFTESTRVGSLARNRAVISADAVAGLLADAARFRSKP